jgi:FkbM family methyltransferase
MRNLYKLILRRAFFRGQDRIFNYLFTNHKFKKESIVVKPIEGNFNVCCDTSTWIGSKIVYTGDYEPELKKIFKSIIKKGDHVLDVGANIGFHTLYFAQLVGNKGTVTSFEPVPRNYEALNININLNNYSNINTFNVALSNKKEQIAIDIDLKSTNPGAYNLFSKGGQTQINCEIGDEVIVNQKIDFIKIDVEGYESFVIDGLLETIKRNKPKIIFEYDKYYHQKTDRPENYILALLATLGYRFQYIFRNKRKDIEQFKDLVSGNILALPNE